MTGQSRSHVSMLWHDSANGRLEGKALGNMRNLMAHEHVESKLMKLGLPCQTLDPKAWSSEGHADIARDLSNLDQVAAEMVEVWRDVIPTH